MINCRKVGRNDFNVFESFMHNWYFIIFFFLIALIQFLGIHYFSFIMRTLPLSRGEWGACICIGSTVLLASAILKMTPESWLKKLDTDKLVDEEKSADNTLIDKLGMGTKPAGPQDAQEPPAVNLDEVDMENGNDDNF